ncbi:MAG: hypothetical protein PHT07_09995 [Paludibacter sp.]|nr:hypothetical protein [Paludibacter sp.]
MAVDKDVLLTIQEVAEKAKSAGVDVGLIFLPIAITYRKQSRGNSLLLFSAIDKQQFLASVGRGEKNIRFAIDAAEILSLNTNYEEGESMKSQDEMIKKAKESAAKILLQGCDEIEAEMNIYKQQQQQPQREKFFSNDNTTKPASTQVNMRPMR